MVDEEQANLEGGGCVGLEYRGWVGSGVGTLVGSECDGVYFLGWQRRAARRKREGSGRNFNCVMLLEAPCFLHDKLLTCSATSER